MFHGLLVKFSMIDVVLANHPGCSWPLLKFTLHFLRPWWSVMIQRWNAILLDWCQCRVNLIMSDQVAHQSRRMIRSTAGHWIFASTSRKAVNRLRVRPVRRWRVRPLHQRHPADPLHLLRPPAQLQVKCWPPKSIRSCWTPSTGASRRCPGWRPSFRADRIRRVSGHVRRSSAPTCWTTRWPVLPPTGRTPPSGTSRNQPPLPGLPAALHPHCTLPRPEASHVTATRASTAAKCSLGPPTWRATCAPTQVTPSFSNEQPPPSLNGYNRPQHRVVASCSLRSQSDWLAAEMRWNRPALDDWTRHFCGTPAVSRLMQRERLMMNGAELLKLNSST